MKCPLLSVGKVTERTGAEDCLERECAWWVRNSGECSILSINGWLSSINAQLYDIWEKQ